MNSRDPRASLDDLDLNARIRQSLRVSFASKSPPARLRRQLLERAAEQRRSLRRLSLPLADWLAHPHPPFSIERGWHHLEYLNILSSLGFVGLPFAIR